MQDITTSQSSTFESIHDDHLDSVNGGCHNKGCGGGGGGGGGGAPAAAAGGGSCCMGGGFAFSFGGMFNMNALSGLFQQGGQGGMGPQFQGDAQGGMGAMGGFGRGQRGQRGPGGTTVQTDVSYGYGGGDSSQGSMQA